MALVLSAATAAIGADQTVQVNVQPADALAIEVQDRVDVSVELGQASEWQGFHMQVLNTTDAGWRVTATSTDLEGFTESNCDEEGNCDETPTGYSIPAAALELWAQDQTNWDPGEIVGFAGSLDNTTPLLLLEGTAVPQGWFGIYDPMTAMRLTAPDDVNLLGLMRGTVTYTIVTYTP